ncbi:MAG: hypothetical protein AAF616_13285 [Bacteroidota bacterium]
MRSLLFATVHHLAQPVNFNTASNTIAQTFELNTNYQGKLAIDAAGNTIVIPVNGEVFRLPAQRFPGQLSSMTPILSLFTE